MNKKALIFLLAFTAVSFDLLAQQAVRKYSFNEVLQIARVQSPMAVSARHRFRGSYWEYRTYKAGFLPTLSLSTVIPDLNRSIDRITLPDGSDAFVERKLINSSANAELSQNIFFTGGNIYMNSSLQRIDLLGNTKSTSYLSYPVNIGIRQPINGYNEFKWQKRIEPIKYEAAKLTYIQALESVTLRAVSYFFDLALAQRNLEITRINYSNADTLYQIAAGRYQLGTIAENELLQMELSYLNAGTALNQAQIDLQVKRFQLNSFLGLNQDEQIELLIPLEIPEVTVDLARALDEAWKNNPDVLARQQQLLNADKALAQAKSEKGLNATLTASFGLSQRSDKFNELYMDPQDQERVRLGLEIPILDWGLARGRYKMAQSAQELAKTNVQQAEMDFQQEVLLEVMQFNLQDDQLIIAAKADTIANNRYEVTKQRFLIGRISVLDLNDALASKDMAARAYVSALRNYWTYFYNLRSLTLYDWLNDVPLQENFEALLQ
jgi:outer membrane protein TolC